ncbi:hypothetical protein PEC301879_40330 [Pectobacterium carotovorum subsp. carotovorum]|nr:hypothetical protein PEC301879_40330 [Pectobacterium carotovorum subsp. carotovorum]
MALSSSISLVGADDDADALLELARALAKKRVVVKRPGYAPPLAGVPAQSMLETKSHRFDFYLPAWHQ